MEAAEFLIDATTVRDKARLQESHRMGSLILAHSSVGEVNQFLAGCKQAQTTLKAPMKKALEQLMNAGPVAASHY